MGLSGKFARFILATSVSLHYNIYKNGMKLANFKISYLNQRKWRGLVLYEYFLCVGYSTISVILKQSFAQLLLENFVKNQIKRNLNLANLQDQQKLKPVAVLRVDCGET